MYLVPLRYKLTWLSVSGILHFLPMSNTDWTAELQSPLLTCGLDMLKINIYVKKYNNYNCGTVSFEYFVHHYVLNSRIKNNAVSGMS